MWIFTKHGFFSAVCARQGDGKHGQSVDPDRILVRARVRGHLDALKKRFPERLPYHRRDHGCDTNRFVYSDARLNGRASVLNDSAPSELSPHRVLRSA
jgi:hypothetical protein